VAKKVSVKSAALWSNDEKELRAVSYFVQCKTCQQEIMIDRDAPGTDTVTITGDFTTFPNCPNCGAEHQDGPSDIRTRAEES
jgi:hypothetical protein